MSSERPKDWCKYMPMDEWWYNTHFHTATQATPYEVVYCQKLPIHLPYFPGESPNAVVDRSMQKREEILKILRGNLEKAQHGMKMQAEKRRSER